MPAAWTTYPGAPRAGTVLCDEAAVSKTGSVSVVIAGFPVIVVRYGEELKAYVNACPHQYLPLDHRSASILSADGLKLICSNHDAVFDIATGAGLSGHGAGCELDEIPVAVTGGAVVIRDVDGSQ